MSIIGETAPAKLMSGGEIAILAAWGAIALALAVWMGVFRRRSIVGPPRVGDREPLGPIALILLGGVMLWLLLPAFLLLAMGQLPAASQSSTQPAATRSAPTISSPALIFASTISQVGAAIVILAANFVARGPESRLLGLTARRLRRGVVLGLVSAVSVVWLVFFAAQLTELVWRFIQYQHAPEHEMLKMLRDSTRPAVSILLIFSAVVMAPVFEEILFRGFLQTLLTHGLHRAISGPQPGFSIGSAFPVAIPDQPPPPLEVSVPPTPAPAGIRWLSVIIASLLFSAVHPVWSIPPIFVLSLALGYVYERTGNLWAPITLHAAFNAVSTAIYMLTAMR